MSKRPSPEPPTAGNEDEHNPKKLMEKEKGTHWRDDEGTTAAAAIERGGRKKCEKEDDIGIEEGSKEEKENGEEEEMAEPVGDMVKISGRGRAKRKHFGAFKIYEKVIKLEEPMLLMPEQKGMKPYIGILKDVRAGSGGRNLTLRVQWLYRPEEAVGENGEPWPAHDREIFLSFHNDEVAAEAVMQKCAVHFLSPAMEMEEERHGFFVKKVYDFRKKVMVDLTAINEFKETERRQIERLLQQTREAWAISTSVEQEQLVEEVIDGPEKPPSCSDAGSKVLDAGRI